MKRVCTLRKVLRSLSKVLLEKLFFIVLISWLFIATQFLLFLSYLQPGDMLWNRNPKYLYKKKFFYQSYCHICHTHINLLIYNGLMVAIDHISVITLLSPIATLQVCQNRHNQLIFRCFLFAFCFFYSLGAWCID